MRALAAGVAAALVLCGALYALEEGTKVSRAKPNPKPSPAAKEEFAEAQKLLGQGLLESARAAVLKGLNEDPKSVEGYNLLGIVEDQRKNYAESVAAFEHALKLSPRSTVTHNNLGNSYVSQNKVDLAENEFRATLRLDPRNRDANFNLGLVLLDRGHPEQAIPFFRSVQPPDAPTSLNLIRAHLRAGQTGRALELARTISEKNKADVRLHFSLGVLLAAEKQYGPAVHELEIADALEPRTFEILHNLGEASLRAKNYAQAAGALERALAVKPDSVDTMVLLARVNSDDRKNLAALELLARAHKLAPKNTDVIFLMARLSMMQNFHEDAIVLLEEGLKITPQRPDLHAALGESDFTVGKVDKAIEEFKTLIQLEPSAASYAFMGLCYRHLGRFDEATKYLLEGLKLDPRNAACLYNLGYIENKQGNPAEAEKLLAQALRVNPDYDDALFELASVNMAQKEFEAALPLLRRSAAISPRPAQVYYKLAIAERALRLKVAAGRDMKIFQTLSKDPASGPYPYQHFFEFLNQRVELPARAKAEVDLQELLRQVDRRPDQPQNLYLLAETYLKLGQTEEAKKAVARLDQASGGDVRTAVGAGVLLARYRLYPEAIQHFRAALAADATLDDARYDLADVYFRVREYAGALEVLEQVSPTARNDDTYLALLGDTYAHLGRTAEAVKIFQDAIAKNPDNDQYFLSLALTQLRTGAPGAAEGTMRQGLARTPNSGKLQWGMGILSVVQGNNARAEDYLNRAVDLVPDWQNSLSALGIFYYQTGQIAKARETLNRSQELNPHSGLDLERIQAVLSGASARESEPRPVKELSPEVRHQFLEVALALMDQAP